MNVNRLRYALNTLLVWMWMWLKGHMNSQVGLEFGHGSNPQQTFLIRIRTSTSSNKRAGDISFSAATPSPFSFSLWKLAMASIKRHLPQEDEHEAKKPKIACVSDAPELKEQHPVVLNPADCDLGISSLSKAFFFFFFPLRFPSYIISYWNRTVGYKTKLSWVCLWSLPHLFPSRLLEF